MNENTASAIMYSVLYICLAAAAIVLIYFGMQSLTEAHKQGTERMQSCTDSGGSWLQNSGGCAQ